MKQIIQRIYHISSFESIILLPDFNSSYDSLEIKDAQRVRCILRRAS